MKNVTAETLLPDGQKALIETQSVLPCQYPQLFKEIVCTHPDAMLLTHGLIRLVIESGHYFSYDPVSAMIGYEYYDISQDEHFLHWITVKSERRGRPNVAGIVEWVPLSSKEVVIQWMYVLKQFRGRGIATALLNEASRQIRSQGYSFLVAPAELEPESGRKFLMRRGFSRITRGVYKKNLNGSNDVFFHEEKPEQEPIIVIPD